MSIVTIPATRTRRPRTRATPRLLKAPAITVSVPRSKGCDPPALGRLERRAIAHALSLLDPLQIDDTGSERDDRFAPQPRRDRVLLSHPMSPARATPRMDRQSPLTRCRGWPRRTETLRASRTSTRKPSQPLDSRAVLRVENRRTDWHRIERLAEPLQLHRFDPRPRRRCRNGCRRRGGCARAAL